jgi:RNA-directed DNA polymerase
LRGWGGYFSPGSHYVPDGVIDAHVYDRVRSFLARRHKMRKRSIRPFSLKAVFGELGVLRMRHCRRADVLS